MTAPIDPHLPALEAVLGDLRGRVDSLERWQATTPDVRHRVAALFTSFPSPVWVPAGPWTVDTLRARIPSAAATDTTFTLARNGTDLLSVTVPAGSVRAASAVEPPVSVDVYDTVQVYRSAGGAAGTVQALGSSTMPDTPSLGGDGSELPAGRVRSTSTATTVASGASACVEMDHSDFTVGGMTYDTGANSRLVIPVDGIYTASAQVVALVSATQNSLTDYTSSQQTSPANPTFPVGFDTASTSADFTAATGSGAGSLTAQYTGLVSISASCTFDNSGAGYGNAVKVYLKQNGSELTGSATTFDLDDGAYYPVFSFGYSGVVPITSGDTLEIWVDWLDGGSTTGHCDITDVAGAYPIYLYALRVDPADGFEAALIVKDSGGNPVDTIAVSGPATRAAVLGTSSFEAQAGERVELWVYNPATNGDIDVQANLSTVDTIHGWLSGTVGKVANTEMQVGWIASGTGNRPGGGEV